MALVHDGVASAVIILPEKPTRVARYAAEELQHHVELASGVRLEIQPESKAESSPKLIYIGSTSAARAASLDAAKLAPEAFALRVTDQAMFILGDDGGGEPLDPDTRAGTLWGVYEWLERDLGVRWLWPGALGTHVPKMKTITARACDEVIPPRFFQRRLRAGSGFESENPALGFTAAAAKEFHAAQAVFLRRHRMGRSYPVSYGHAFTDWWQKDGQKHPEWFQQLESGRRGPAKKNGRFSNVSFQREIVKRWTAQRPPGAKTPAFINACENDILGLCICDNCLALDAPPPPDHLRYYPHSSKMTGSRYVSERYARFWLGVQQLAPPDATVVGYAYFNYFAAPTSGIKLNPNILIGYCPSAGWFPRSEEEHTWMKQQCTSWHETGARLFMRTNHLLDGYCMPFLFVHQFVDEFHHAVKHGMAATDYDSLTGHWATQGPHLYAAARLHVRPEASAEALLAEYFSAFGPAAEAVQRYFSHWESYTTSSREKLVSTMEDTQTSRWRNWAKAAHLLYPPECFAIGEAILQRATPSAQNHPEAAARIQFLLLGLQHAKLCSQVSAKLSLASSIATPAEITTALRELLRFRRTNEHSGISNFDHLAWQEDLSWKLTDEVKQPPEVYP